MVLPLFQAEPGLHLKHVSLHFYFEFASLEEKLPIFNSNPSSSSFPGAFNLSVLLALAEIG